ncbi:hypothetical protein I6J39_17000 [Streptomyces californicus]|uniref:Transposase n=1 Tax=Streptomyces californicus TaxID=67351 RepID=A0ABX7JBF4_9ACTN|nr:hypothetical protein I6J39_17000 [Streptomyces californicus]QRV45517.1 hypothetical protein I6J41_16915 [Streptomyces californicus]
MTWAGLLEQWALIEADFQQTYGIDLDTPGLMRARSWRWLKTRIYGLLSAETRINRHFAPPERSK